MENDKLKGKNIVFIISLILIAAMAIWSVGFNDNFTVVSNAVYAFLTTDFAWLYLIAMIVFVAFVLFVAFSKFGKVKLGGDDSKPEFKNFTWFGLLFGCGMGVGLVFWGVAEPLTHYLNPAAFSGAEAATPQAADFAIESFFMHWGFLPWANYAVVGLALAYFMFRKKKPGLISSMLTPLMGEKLAQGWLGKLIDILAVFATVAAIVTSLGLGTLQINAGFNELFGIPNNLTAQIVIIAIVSVIYIASAVSGIEKGIKIISDTNLYVAIGLMLACFIVGPIIPDLNSFVSGFGNYINNFLVDSLGISAFGDNAWIGSWRLFYWAWFIAWAPFVGVFIAKISKGRTVREFVLGVVIVPAVASCIWGVIFGNLGINLVETGKMTIEAAAAAVANPERGLFVVLQQYPIGFILCIVALVSLCAFFVTSANSGVYVMSMLTSNGDQNPPASKKILWGIVIAIITVGLLMAGGLKPLQTISLAAAFPFIIIMFAICISFYRVVKREFDPITGKQRTLEEANKADEEAEKLRGEGKKQPAAETA